MRSQKFSRPHLLTYAIALTLWVGGWVGAARAEITATVYPGYQFSVNERPTANTLNLLGRPTIYITGTLGGTNVALAANSVTTTMMSDTLPGSNLVWDSSSPRKLVIEDAAVSVNQVNSALAGLGLSGGSGSALRVNVDTNTVQITNDVVTLNLSTLSNLVTAVANVTNTANYVVTNYTATNLFATAEIALGTGLLTNAAHGLGARPSMVWVVLRCLTNDLDYAAGDEVNADHLQNNARPVYTVGGNSTNVFLIGGTEATQPALPNKLTGASWQNITTARWRAVLRARL